MLLSIFSKITQRDALTEKITTRGSSLHLYILFPITVAFLITFTSARIITHLGPNLYLLMLKGVRVHHFTLGIITLVASGYLALVAHSSRDKYFIALLYGSGLGLAFDEFGIWLKLSDNSSARYSYDGVVVLVAFFILMISARFGTRMWNRYFDKKEPH